VKRYCFGAGTGVGAGSSGAGGGVTGERRECVARSKSSCALFMQSCWACWVGRFRQAFLASSSVAAASRFDIDDPADLFGVVTGGDIGVVDGGVAFNGDGGVTGVVDGEVVAFNGAPVLPAPGVCAWASESAPLTSNAVSVGMG